MNVLSGRCAKHQILPPLPKINIIAPIYDSLAQSVEHVTFNHGVRGSNPRWITKRIQTHQQCALLAQLVEQLTLNQWVLGSSPRWRTNKKPAFDMLVFLLSVVFWDSNITNYFLENSKSPRRLRHRSVAEMLAHQQKPYHSIRFFACKFLTICLLSFLLKNTLKTYKINRCTHICTPHFDNFFYPVI